MGLKVPFDENKQYLFEEYKNVNLENPETDQICLVTDGRGFYDVMLFNGSSFVCPWNKYYKIVFWKELPLIKNQKEMLKEQTEIEIDKELMRQKKF